MELVKKHNGLFLYDGSKLAGYLTYALAGGRMAIEHTFVDAAYRGQGLAAKLMERAVAEAKANSYEIVPICSYAKGYLEKHPI